MGWREDLSYRRKLRIAEAACTLVCYDLGHNSSAICGDMLQHYLAKLLHFQSLWNQ